MGVQVGVAGAGVAVGEHRCEETFGVNLGDGVGAFPGVAGGLFQPGEGVGDGFVVGGFDEPRGVQRGDGPQGGDGFDGGEGEVVPGDRGGGWAGKVGEVAGQFLLGARWAVVLGGEHVGGDMGADALLVRLRRRQALLGFPLRVRLVQGFPPPADLGEDRERPAQLHLARDFPQLLPAGPFGAKFGDGFGFDPLRVGVQPLSEEVFHLLFGDLAGDVDPGHPGAGPVPGGLAFGGVVRLERRRPLDGGVGGGDLPDQVGVAVAGGQLVQRHHSACTAVRSRALQPARARYVGVGIRP